MKQRLFKYIKIIFTLYAGAWLLSWFIQIYFPDTDKPNLYQKTTEISGNGSTINHRFYHFENEQSGEAIILIPDLFGGPDFLVPLAQSLHDSLNVIIPVYPKTTTSDRTVSHSIESRARFIHSLADSLNLQNIHLAGHGYGGLIAINLASDTLQTKYDSLVLLSSYGPVELQFLGNHLVNKSLYSLLYPVVTVFKYLTPHMGWYYEQQINFHFTRTLTELDQRPVRDQLHRIEGPVYILHPLNDRYVPLAIAEENHRLIPQSSVFIINGDHNTTRETPQVISRRILEFLDDVESQQAYVKKEASPGRIEASKEPFDADEFATIGGWTLLIIMFLLALSTLLSEDLACIAAGLLVASGIIDFWYAVLACCIGVLVEDIGTYFLGKWFGNPILQRVPFRWFIKEEDIVRAEQMFRMRGVEIIFLSRFLPGIRFPTYLASGMIRVKFSFFMFYFLLALFIWAPLLVGISALIGQPMISYLVYYQDYALWLIPVVIGLIYLLIKGMLMISTATGRRKLIVKIGRFRERYFGRHN